MDEYKERIFKKVIKELEKIPYNEWGISISLNEKWGKWYETNFKNIKFSLSQDYIGGIECFKLCVNTTSKEKSKNKEEIIFYGKESLRNETYNALKSLYSNIILKNIKPKEEDNLSKEEIEKRTLRKLEDIFD